MSPLVSIIIPTYNRAHLISETLASIITQTYTNWECIVVDDGSTDGTEGVLKALCNKDKRFQYHKRPSDRPKGANACRNYGLELSKGKYVNWFDSDDLMVSQKLAIQIDDIEKGDYDFSVTQTEQFDLKNNISLGMRSESLVSDNLIDDFISFKAFWLFPSVLWKKDYLIKNKLFLNEKLQQAQDFDFHLSVLKLKPLYVHNDFVTTKILVHSSNVGNSLVDSPGKVYSNAYVQYRIMSEFKRFISEKTLVKSQDYLCFFYREALRQRQKVNALKIYKLVGCTLFNANFSSSKKVTLLFKYALGLMYPFFNIGFKFTKVYYGR